MEENNYKFSYTCYAEMDSDGNATGIVISGPSKITKIGMFAFCWPGCLTVMYDREAVGLIQIEDIKKNTLICCLQKSWLQSTWPYPHTMALFLSIDCWS